MAVYDEDISANFSPGSEGLEMSTLRSSPSWLGFYPQCPWAICSNSAGAMTSSHDEDTAVPPSLDVKVQFPALIWLKNTL